MSKFTFIVGMYKSGTSWLLAALSAHPDLIGLREFDVVKAVCRQEGSRFVERTADERISQFFGRSSWCSLDRKYLVAGAWQEFLEAGEAETIPASSKFSALPAELAVKLLLRMRSATVNNKVAHKGGKHSQVVISAGDGSRFDPGRPLSFIALDESSLVDLFEGVRAAKAAPDALHLFLNLLHDKFKPAAGLVLKGADQVGGIAFLDEHVKAGKKIVIVRDGRDAALSASHYRALVERRSMAWSAGSVPGTGSTLSWRTLPAKAAWHFRNLLGFHTRLDYLLSLLSWQRRIRQVLAHARKNEIHVVRYEDLTLAFDETMIALLDWLGLRCDAEVLAEMRKRSSFESMTGRQRGEAEDAVVRKGQVGEWQEELSGLDKFLAWRLVGRSLSALGYTIDGKLAARPEFPIS